jgi:hypothetical protein
LRGNFFAPLMNTSDPAILETGGSERLVLADRAVRSSRPATLASRSISRTGIAPPARTAPNHEEHPTDLRQQSQQDQPQHSEVLGYRPQHAAGAPRDQLDCCVGLRVGRLPDTRHRRVEELTAFGDRGFAFAAELPHAAFALPIAGRHRVRQGTLSGRDGRRDASIRREGPAVAAIALPEDYRVSRECGKPAKGGPTWRSTSPPSPAGVSS